MQWQNLVPSSPDFRVVLLHVQMASACPWTLELEGAVQSATVPASDMLFASGPGPMCPACAVQEVAVGTPASLQGEQNRDPSQTLPSF